MVEGAEESGPTGAEATGPLRSQEAEPSMEVDMDDILPLTSGDTTIVTAEEDEMLTGDTTSMSGEMAMLQVSSLTAISPRTVKPHSRSRPPQRVSKALHMSPPHRLRRRRKKEDSDVRIGKEVTSRTQRQNQAVFMYYYTRSCNGGRRVDLFAHKVTAIVKLHCYS